MVKDAELHAAEDAKRKEVVEARNQLDALIYRVEKNVEDLGDDLEGAVKSEIEAAVAKAKQALDSDDVSALKAAAEELEKSSHKLAEALYKKAQAEQASSGGGGSDDSAASASANGAAGATNSDGESGDDDVVDADFEEVKPS